MIAFDPPPPKTEPAVFTVLTACRLVLHKGVACLLQAMARIAGEWRLRVTGDGPERANLQSLARELGIAEQVTFLGDLDHKTIAAEMAASSLFALASERKPFGVVLIDAASCGTPVVATRTSGATDIVTDQIGILADIDDAPALATAIEEMRNRQHDVDGARAYCAERYSPASVNQWGQTRLIQLTPSALRARRASTAGPRSGIQIVDDQVAFGLIAGIGEDIRPHISSTLGNPADNRRLACHPQAKQSMGSDSITINGVRLD